ncbi:hypothetical protein P43SY_007259 [Pythium insidiosum]|uniref:FCP1 homology domain-containing protein n=1 Tax=Pythium insidiosum TaxID=114742 RepID=A0AAD5M212_PYTIN|nr:hypothetical protein P43SY_007259 [Pythium insidiosum]
MASRSGRARVSGAAVARISPAAPVLFLDVDGVLNVQTTAAKQPQEPFSRLHESLVARLAAVIRRTQARVVLSSSWRYDPQRQARLRRLWRRERLPPIDAETPSLPIGPADSSGADVYAAQRVAEISAWLDAEQPARWAAVDDLDLAAAAHSDVAARFIRTHPRRGLQQDDCEALVALLGEAPQATEWRPWPCVVESIQDRADLLVVWAPEEDTMVVLDTSDFREETRFSGTDMSLRQWLMARADHVSAHRVAAVVLATSRASSLETAEPLSWLPPELIVSVAVESVIATFVAQLQTTASSEWTESDATSVAGNTLTMISGRLQAHATATFCASAATERLLLYGFATRHIELFLSNESFAIQLVETLSMLSTLTPVGVALAVEITRRFRGELYLRLRRCLAECVERREVTSADILTAVQSWASPAVASKGICFSSLEQTLMIFSGDVTIDE